MKVGGSPAARVLGVKPPTGVWEVAPGSRLAANLSPSALAGKAPICYKNVKQSKNWQEMETKLLKAVDMAEKAMQCSPSGLTVQIEIFRPVQSELSTDYTDYTDYQKDEDEKSQGILYSATP